MTLEETIAFYKSKNKKSIIAYETTNHSKVEFSQIIEVPLKGNYHLSVVFSKDNNTTELDFLVNALKALEYDTLYDISKELSGYNLEVYSFKKNLNEIWFPKTKEILKLNNFIESNCNFIYKLRDKDEQTFLIEMKTQYIFIQEIYWKS